jgi:hypothetical protein
MNAEPEKNLPPTPPPSSPAPPSSPGPQPLCFRPGRTPRDIAADFFALRKFYTGTRWTFTEGHNTFNPASHCDIAWAGALASHAHTQHKGEFGIAVGYEHGWSDGKTFHPYTNPEYNTPAPPPPNQTFTLACGFCSHRPPHFDPPPSRCQKCGLHIPKS